MFSCMIGVNVHKFPLKFNYGGNCFHNCALGYPEIK